MCHSPQGEELVSVRTPCSKSRAAALQKCSCENRAPTGAVHSPSSCQLQQSGRLTLYLQPGGRVWTEAARPLCSSLPWESSPPMPTSSATRTEWWLNLIIISYFYRGTRFLYFCVNFGFFSLLYLYSGYFYRNSCIDFSGMAQFHPIRTFQQIIKILRAFIFF